MVAAGLADRCEIQVAYAIGVVRPLSINVETFGTGKVADDVIVEAIDNVFDLRPGAIIRDLGRSRPIYRQTALASTLAATTLHCRGKPPTAWTPYVAPLAWHSS